VPTLLPRPGDRLSPIASRVSTIELLFDLVFVTTISQVAAIIVHEPDWSGIGQALVILALVWWMYDAYAWLTNQAAPDTTFVRLALIVAMAAFLVMSLAIPDAFGATGVVFGAAYIAVAFIHAALFIARGGRDAARRIVVVGTSNILVGVLLMVSGFVEGPIDWLFFTVPLLAFLASAILSARGGFDPGASHMVERHGLLMIIAFGESIVSIGVAAAAHALDAPLIVATVLSVGIVASLWWCYFAGDDVRAEEAIAAAPQASRTRLALVAYYLEHLAMIFGLVLMAAGLHELLVEAAAPAPPTAAALLGCGVGLYLLADVAYRSTLRLGPIGWRAAGAALVALTFPIGIAVSGLAQLVAVLALVAGVLIAEAVARGRIAGRSPAVA
jgi:low temperature requirement protein LtrA